MQWVIYQQALAKFGEDAQMDMAVEECAELIVALKHFRRERCGVLEIASELADVQIMVNQMKEIVGHDKFNAAMNVKFDRLAETIRGKG